MAETVAGNPPPQPPPVVTAGTAAPGSWDSRISPSILLIIAILAIIFFLSGLLHLLIRYLLASRHREPHSTAVAAATALQGQLQQLFHLHDSGVDQSFIDALPVFLYRSLTKDPFDCAVCLCEFDPDDRLRLLPKCSHAFHLACIDTWLLSHSTCPLCRRSLVPPEEDFEGLLQPTAVSDRASVANSHCSDDPPVVSVKLGKFRTLEGEGSSAVDQRRCFSMGHFEYVLDERSLATVAIEPPPDPDGRKRRRMAMSECDCRSQDAKKEAWLRTAAARPAGAGEEGSKGVPSFRWGSDYDSGSETCYDVESVSDGNRSGAVVSRGEEAPSFARRTMLWVMGRSQPHGNRIGTTSHV